VRNPLMNGADPHLTLAPDGSYILTVTRYDKLQTAGQALWEVGLGPPTRLAGYTVSYIVYWYPHRQEPYFSEECKMTEGKGTARRAAEQTGEAGKGGSATREALTYCQRRQGGTRKGNARGGGCRGCRGNVGEGDKHRNKILSPALARCGKHCATGCKSSGTVPTAGGRSVDASRDILHHQTILSSAPHLQDLHEREMHGLVEQGPIELTCTVHPCLCQQDCEVCAGPTVVLEQAGTAAQQASPGAGTLQG
jgi:hypothetical protein